MEDVVIKEGRMPCIYKITSPSGKAYIGKTVNFRARMSQHQGKGSTCGAIKSAIQKYGWDNMKVEILLYCAEEDCPMYEKAMIAAYDTFGENGYDIAVDGATDDYSHSTLGNPVVITRTQAEGAIEGKHVDYITTSRFNTSFSYSRFHHKGSDTCAPRDVSLLTGKKHKKAHLLEIASTSEEHQKNNDNPYI